MDPVEGNLDQANDQQPLLQALDDEERGGAAEDVSEGQQSRESGLQNEGTTSSKGEKDMSPSLDDGDAMRAQDEVRNDAAEQRAVAKRRGDESVSLESQK